MARLSDGPDKGFDAQYDHAKRLGRERAARGEGPWAADASLRRITAQPGDANHKKPKHAKPTEDSCVAALALLGGLGWALTEAVRYIT